MATLDAYYDAALVCIALICERCGATLHPDEDLGPKVSFQTDGWYMVLGDEAYRRGWVIDTSGDDVTAICPTCAKNRT